VQRSFFGTEGSVLEVSAVSMNTRSHLPVPLLSEPSVAAAIKGEAGQHASVGMFDSV